MRWLLLLMALMVFKPAQAEPFPTAAEAQAECERDLAATGFANAPDFVYECQFRKADPVWCGGYDCYRIFYTRPTWAGWEGTLEAYSFETCDAGSPACNAGAASPGANAGEPCSPGCGVGDPINPATGNKYELKREYDGGGSAALAFGWTYNSVSLSTPAASSKAAGPGILGRHRTHTFERRVVVQSGTQVLVDAADGKRWAFVASAGAWRSASRAAGDLRQLRAPNGAAAGWTFQNAQGEQETYDASGRLSAIRARGGLTQTLEYNPQGQIASVTDITSRQLQFDYNAKGLLEQLFTPDGIILFQYDAADNLSRVQYPDGSVVGYRYNEAGYMGSVGYPHALTGVIDESSLRYSSTTYDQAGRATGTSLAGNASAFKLHYLPSPDGTFSTSTVVLGPSGETQSLRYVIKKGIAVPQQRRTICEDGRCTPRYDTYGYDADGFVTDSQDKSRSASRYAYDVQRGLALRHVEAEATAQQRITWTTWHPDLRLPVEQRVEDATNTLVARSTWTYNGRGQMLTSTQHDPATGAVRTTSTSYCEQADVDAGGSCPLAGLVKAVDGPRTDVRDITAYAYYAGDAAGCVSAPATCAYRKGDLWKVTSALGQVSEILRYDAAGRVLSSRDANGVVSEQRYGPRGWRLASMVRGADDAVETDDAITRYTHTPTGLIRTIVQPDGASTRFTYDAAHRLTDITDNVGNTIHYTLDQEGKRLLEETKDAGGALTRRLSRLYNDLGQLATQADAQSNPTDFAYDANGNLDTASDALRRKTDHDYDPLDRLARTLQDVGGIAAETRYGYDALNRLVRVTDPNGLPTEYRYDGLGNLTRLGSPDTGVTSYTHDSAGNRTTQLDARGVSARYAYDALNRPTAITYPTASLNVTFAYDTTTVSQCPNGETFGQGRLTGFSDGSGSTSLCYDRLGRLTRKIQSVEGRKQVTVNTYDLAGQLLTRTLPSSTRLSYGRDAAGRVVSVRYRHVNQTAETVLVSAVTYYPFGPVAKITYGNGRVLTRTYDQDYTIDRISSSGPGGLELDFTANPVEDLTQVTAGAVGNTLAYDSLGRLAKVNALGGAPVAEYRYDKTGNRTSKQTAAASQAYTYAAGSHRLSAVAGVARSYDGAGNTTAIGPRGFVHGDHGRMLASKDGSSVLMNYAYNAQGERVTKFVGSSKPEYFVYDDAGRLLGHYVLSGGAKSARLREYVWLDDLPVAMFDGSAGTAHYIEPDHLGTPRAVIDPVRNVAVWTWPLVNDAFGEGLPNQDADGDGVALEQPLRFPGQFADKESGLSYNYFRDYDNGTGRYIESDPIGLLGGLTTYNYAENQPLMLSDPLGEAAIAPAIPVGAVGTGAIGGLALPPAAAVAGAGLIGYGVGTLIYNGIEAPLGGAIDAICKDETLEQQCDHQYYDVDIPTCRAIAKRRGRAAGQRCFSKAADRYAACLREEPRPPLDTWNN